MHWMKLRMRTSANVILTKIHLISLTLIHIFRGSVFYLRTFLSSLIFLHISLHSLIYLSMCSVLSTIVQKGGDCWCKFLAPWVLEIVDRNSHGLICLLVHTERNSPCCAEAYAEDNVVPGEQFEELHRRLSTSKKINELHNFGLWSKKNEVKEMTPRKFIADAKQLVR